MTDTPGPEREIVEVMARLELKRGEPDRLTLHDRWEAAATLREAESQMASWAEALVERDAHLAAAKEREARLREALGVARAEIIAALEEYGDDDPEGYEPVKVIDAALATATGENRLDGREQCAKVAEGFNTRNTPCAYDPEKPCDGWDIAAVRSAAAIRKLGEGP